jgi:hypothetical protein
MLFSRKNVIVGALLLSTTALISAPLSSSASEDRIAVVAAAPRANPDLKKEKIDFPEKTRQAQEVKIRRNFDKPAAQDKVVRSHQRNLDKVLILGVDNVESLAM